MSSILTRQEKIIDENLESEMETSFLQYAYSVIYQRALPDAKDGLKPVQRRILFQMSQMRLFPDKPYVKSARVVGDVMGKLHPHGDSAIYDALVRLSQDFILRLPLVDGHGNFGSLDNGPAAARYTEARMAESALEMTQFLNEDVVDFEPNYDNKLSQPSVLPAAIPNLLVNGASGIAVGMATNMAPHNLGEIIDGAIHFLQNPECSLDDLMKFVKGPDMPGGGYILGIEGIKEAYETGRGSFNVRAKVAVENITPRKKAIIVSELPYMIGPEKVLDRIKEAVNSGKVQGLSSTMDLTDRDNGLKLVLEIKSGYDPGAILASLYQYTNLEEAFNINNVALVEGEPQQLGLKQLIQVWAEHRIDVITRRSKFRLKKHTDRLHLVEGLLKAILDIDEAIRIIRNSETSKEAAAELKAFFNLDDLQVDYILDLQLRRLTKLSKNELQNEQQDLQNKIKELQEILADKQKIKAVTIAEMEEVKLKYATPRRSVIIGDKPPLPNETFIPVKVIPSQTKIKEEPTVIVLSSVGKIAKFNTTKLSPNATANRQTFDSIATILETKTTADFAVLTNLGNLYKVPVADILTLETPEPDEQGQTSLNLATASNFSDLLGIPGEKPIQIFPDVTESPIAIGTKDGIVKRIFLQTEKKEAVSIITLKEGDFVIGATLAPDEADLCFITDDAQMLRFNAAKVRPQGKSGGGMAGISLKDAARAIFFSAVQSSEIEELTVISVAGESQALPGTQTGFGKVTPYNLYPYKGRATGGVRVQRFLKGQNTLIFAGFSKYRRANTSNGDIAELPELDLRRDGSGVALTSAIAGVG